MVCESQKNHIPYINLIPPWIVSRHPLDMVEHGIKEIHDSDLWGVTHNSVDRWLFIWLLQIQEEHPQLIERSSLEDASSSNEESKSPGDESSSDFNRERSEPTVDDPNDIDYIPHSETALQTHHTEDSDQKRRQSEIYEALKPITNYFNLTYTQIKSMPQLQEEPLVRLSPKEIMDYIRVNRQKLKRQRQETSKQERAAIKSNLSQKRTFAQTQLPLSDKQSLKRVQKVQSQSGSNQGLQLARYLVNEFQTFENDIQYKVLKALDSSIKSDPDLLKVVLNRQVKALAKDAKLFYETKQQVRLNDLLSNVSPMAAILINIEISLVNANYMEEGNTLSETLLPYINQVNDYSFLPEKAHFIAQRFVTSLAKHILDIKGEVGVGFMLLAIKLSPSRLVDIIPLSDNRSVLVRALDQLHFAKQSAELIATYPMKFLWPDLFKFFDGKTEKIVNDCIQLISKMEVLSDPGSQMNSLLDIFAQRRLMLDLLLEASGIKLGVTSLIRVLEVLLPMQSDTITKCLKQDSSNWELFSIQSSCKEEDTKQQLPMQQVSDLYTQYTRGCKDPVPLQEMIDMSLQMSSEVELYRHCEYQAAIAAIVVSQNAPFTIVVSPTGSGKTWIQALVAKYYCTQGQGVTLVEPTEDLRYQAAEKVGLVDFGISIATIDQFYSYSNTDPIVLLDEFDNLIDERPYGIYNNIINGLWQLKGKRVIAFTATSSIAYERLVNNCITRPLPLKFKSEYEHIHGISPIQDANIVCCGSPQAMRKQLSEDISKYYDQKPIIVIIDDEQEEELEKSIKAAKYRYNKSISNDTLAGIRLWDYGILILKVSESRGIDTRFQRDAVVLVIAHVVNQNQLQQMIGRSSRTRGVCECILYISTQETRVQVMERLRKQNIAGMQDLEQFLKLLEKKEKNDHLLKVLMKEQEKGQMIKSIKELQQSMQPTQYKALIKHLTW